jgi:hypothetical protein
MFQKIYNLIKILIITFAILVILNIFFFLFNNRIIKQEFLSRNYLRNFPISYQVFYPETNDRKYSNYTAIIGDSYALGVGDAYFDIKIEEYSIAHFLRKLNHTMNFITFAWPGGGSISHLKLFNMMNEKFFFRRTKEYPNKIIYLFDEENDLTDDYNEKYQGIYTYVFTYKEYLKQVFPIFYYTYRLIKNRINYEDKGKIIKNEIIFKEKNINLINSSRIAVPEIYDEELLQSLFIIKNNLRIFKNKVNDINFVFIPSVATIYEMKDPITSISYRDGKKIEISNDEMNLYNLYITAELEKICNDLNINFINLTEDLRNKAKQELIHGPNDWSHPNLEGYKYIAELINSKVLN